MPRYNVKLYQTRVLGALDEEGEDGIEADSPEEAKEKAEAAYYEDRVYVIDTYLQDSGIAQEMSE